MKVRKLGDKGWLVMYTASKPLGAWKWAFTRVVTRIAFTPMNPEKYIYDERSCAKQIYESQDYTLDYEGGNYGWSRPEKMAKEYFNNIKIKDIKY